MQYSRNLGAGDGIELVVDHHPTGLSPPAPAPGLGLTNRFNPFNPRTTLRFALSAGGQATLRLALVR